MMTFCSGICQKKTDKNKINLFIGGLVDRHDQRRPTVNDKMSTMLFFCSKHQINRDRVRKTNYGLRCIRSSIADRVDDRAKENVSSSDGQISQSV